MQVKAHETVLTMLAFSHLGFMNAANSIKDFRTNHGTKTATTLL